jgi:hypothetical protein
MKYYRKFFLNQINLEKKKFSSILELHDMNYENIIQLFLSSIFSLDFHHFLNVRSMNVMSVTTHLE